jgi:DcmR-like sensory protein
MCIHDHKTPIHLGFTEQEILAGTHICFIYNNEAERRDITVKFLASAFRDNEKVVFFADKWDTTELKQQLSEEGVDVALAEESGELTISDVSAAYFPNGSFSAEEMWQRLSTAYNESIESGYKGWRGSGEMSWALRDIKGNDQLIKYEAGINNEMKTRPYTVICQYNANLFSGAVLLEVLRVHPYMIAKGKVVNNPHYEA